MVANDPVDAVFDRLRRLAAGDPRRAREDFLQFVTQQPGLLVELLERVTRPGEGRVRQVVATAARLESSLRGALRPWLERWIGIEPDEFTRRAIAAALAADDTVTTLPPAPATAELPRGFSETYRYVTERVCHRVRNALAPADTELLRLERFTRSLATPVEKATLTDILGCLQAGLDRAARVVEFDRRDEYMTWAAFDLADWLRRSASNFASWYGNADATIDAPAGTLARVWAAPFLLDLAFGNLWANAVQTAGPGCKFVVEIVREKKEVVALIRDSGPGFDETSRAAAFETQYSTKPGNHGRGLLEVADAVARMLGRVALVQVKGDGYRVQIHLPSEGT